MTALLSHTPGGSLVLSLFPGIDLLGRGFELEGFCVVRGPDLIYGGDVRSFHVPAGRFDGVIAGTPCQDFSTARRDPPTGEGVAMLAEFRRLVTEARPDWWLLENVPPVPDVRIDGYSWLRIPLDARDCGSRQARLRHIQFGSARGLVPVVSRVARAKAPASRCCVATEGDHREHRRSWADFCELQGLPRNFDLPGLSIAARYRAVGNGVPVPMARTLARAIRAAVPASTVRLCACGCGAILDGPRAYFGPACRKRAQRARDAAAVTGPGPVTVDQSPGFASHILRRVTRAASLLAQVSRSFSPEAVPALGTPCEIYSQGGRGHGE